MPPGMETDPLPPLFCPPVQEHLKAKVAGAQLLASSLLAHSQSKASWKAGCFPSWPLPPTRLGKKGAGWGVLFTQGSVFLPWKVLELLFPMGLPQARRGVWDVVLAQIMLSALKITH